MENQNSICFIAKINEIKPIEGADNIELGVIGGEFVTGEQYHELTYGSK
jgi:hypothetical protein